MAALQLKLNQLDNLLQANNFNRTPAEKVALLSGH